MTIVGHLLPMKRGNRMKVDILTGTAGVIAFAFALTSATQSWTHHAFGAEFDAELPIVLKGPITKLEWVNPHSWIHLEHTNEAGQKEQWMVEGGTPNTLLRAGINKNTVKIGAEIVVRGYQSKDKLCKPACKANGRDITFPDGRKLFMGSSGTGAPRDGADPREPKRTRSFTLTLPSGNFL